MIQIWTLEIYLSDMSRILLQPPKLDSKCQTELSNLEPHVSSIAIAEDHKGVGDSVEVSPCHNVQKDIKEHFGSHPTFLRQTEAPFSGYPISPHVLQLVGGNIPGSFVDQPDGDDVTTGGDGDRGGDMLFTASALVVEHVPDPHIGKNLDMISTNCQGCLILEYEHNDMTETN